MGCHNEGAVLQTAGLGDCSEFLLHGHHVSHRFAVFKRERYGLDQVAAGWCVVIGDGRKR